MKKLLFAALMAFSLAISPICLSADAPVPAAKAAAAEVTPAAAPAAAPIAASAVAAPAAAPDTAMPGWVQTLIVLMNALVATVLLPFLRAKALAAEAEMKKHEADATLSGMSQRELLSSRVKSFMLRTAANFTEKRWPGLALRIQNGELKTPEAIKAELRSWGVDLKKDAIAYFANQGIDLVAEVGDKYLDQFVEWAANSTSPFPGKETAVEVLKSKVTNSLIEHGVAVLRNKYLSAEGV